MAACKPYTVPLIFAYGQSWALATSFIKRILRIRCLLYCGRVIDFTSIVSSLSCTFFLFRFKHSPHYVTCLSLYETHVLLNYDWTFTLLTSALLIFQYILKVRKQLELSQELHEFYVFCLSWSICKLHITKVFDIFIDFFHLSLWHINFLLCGCCYRTF